MLLSRHSKYIVQERFRNFSKDMIELAANTADSLSRPIFEVYLFIHLSKFANLTAEW